MPVKSSAAATGVPNSAPTVAAPAIRTEICGETLRSNRANRATAMPTLIAMIGFSGPRLTPPARLEHGHHGEPGSTAGASGGAMSSVVAESGPPWPGATTARCPRQVPVRVRISTIHQPVGSTPSASGSVSQSTRPAGRPPEEGSAPRAGAPPPGTDDDRGDREQQELSRGTATVSRRSRKAHRGPSRSLDAARVDAAMEPPLPHATSRVERSAADQWTSRPPRDRFG